MKDVLDRYLSCRVDGTCEWLLQRQCWRKWIGPLDSPDPCQILWVNAPAGFGKSVHCAALIDYLRNLGRKVAFFFYSSQTEEKRHPVAALRSWILQLISYDVHLSHHILESSIHGPGEPSELQLWALLRSVVENMSDAILVADGLDECNINSTDMKHGPHSTRINFMEKLRSQIGHSQTRVLLFSRDEPDIREGVLKANETNNDTIALEYRITSDDLFSDLGAVSLNVVQRKLKRKPETIRAEICKTLQTKSNGMFLWITLQEHGLNSTMTMRELRNAVMYQPVGLDSVFARIWTDITCRPNRDGQRALQILRWLAFAKRPLTVAELTEALLIDDLDDQDDSELAGLLDEDFVNERIQGICGSLVAVDGDDDGALSSHSTVRLFHDSVKSFLVSKFQSREVQVNGSTMKFEYIGKLCLSYLSKAIVWKASDSKFCILGSFKSYASLHWPDHMRDEYSLSSFEKEALLSFFSKSNQWWYKWRDAFEQQRLSSKSYPPGEREYYAAEFGYTFILQRLRLEDSLRTDQLGGWYGYPLQAACFYAHEETVEYLLGVGASVKLAGKPYGSALTTAAFANSTHLVRRLLESGADDMGNVYGTTALYYAAAHGNMAAVCALYEHKRSIYDKHMQFPPLYGAIYYGHIHIVQYLVECGFSANSSLTMSDDNIVDYRGSSAGQQAARQDTWSYVYCSTSRGHTSITRYLIDKGADVNTGMATPPYWTPLHAACFWGNEGLVGMLLQSGAAVDVYDVSGISPLHLAAQEGHVPVVRLLLLCRTDINVTTVNATSKDKDENSFKLDMQQVDCGWTPLHVASYKGHSDLVQVLVEAGARIDMRTGTRQDTALTCCIRNGHVEVLRYLAENGASLKVHDRYQHTPLRLAVQGGHTDILKFLLIYGLDVNEDQHESQVSLLAMAAAKEDEDAVSILVQYGAVIDSRCEDGWTPLHWASRTECFATVELLLDKGANVNACTEYHYTPLHLAAMCSAENIVRLLLDHGAAADARCYGGWTPLHLTSEKNKVENMVVLLNHSTASINAHSDIQSTPLHVAAAYNNRDAVSILIRQGASLDAQDSDRYTALHYASNNTCCETLKILIESGANINACASRGITPLHLAAQCGQEKALQTLIECGAGVDVVSGSGDTALTYASRDGHLSCVKRLVTHRAVLDVPLTTSIQFSSVKNFLSDSVLASAGAQEFADGFNNPIAKPIPTGSHTSLGQSDTGTYDWVGQTALGSAALNSHFQVVEILLLSKSNPRNASISLGYPLLNALEQDDVKISTLLYEAAQDVVHKTDIFGRTVLHSNVHENQLAFVKRFPNVQSLLQQPDGLGRLPIHKAATGTRSCIIDWILDHDLPFDIADNHSWTPTHWAAYFGNLEILRTLRSNGARIDTRDWQGRLPYHLALYGGHQAAANLLQPSNALDLAFENMDSLISLNGYCDCCNHVSIVEIFPSDL